MRPLLLSVFISALSMLLACSDSPSNRSAADGSASNSDNALVENRGADKDNWWDALPRSAWANYERIPQAQDWFEVYRVLDGIYAIYEPGQFEEVISYLIVGDEQALLFDTGLGIGDMRAVVATLTELDVVVLNSHTHYDHIGGNHQFDMIYGVDTAYSLENEAGSTPDELAEFIGPGWVWKPFPSSFDAEAYRTLPYTVSERVTEGQRFDLGGRILEVLMTPGHSPDSLCLIDRDNRLLFTGDTFYLAPLYTHLHGSDFARYLETARRLRGLAGSVDRLLTAHNVPLVSGDFLTTLGDAFETIASGRGDYSLADGHREYDFGEFSVIVADDVLN